MHVSRATSCLCPGSPEIAVTGHTSLHSPLPSQRDPMSAFGLAFTSSTMALVGHTAAQIPQFVHFE